MATMDACDFAKALLAAGGAAFIIKCDDSILAILMSSLTK
jgi:hypothetical protein